MKRARGGWAYLVLVAALLQWGCAPSEEELAAREAAEAITALPQPSPRLHMDRDDKLSMSSDVASFTQTNYLYGGDRVLEWKYPLAGETLLADPSYQVVMASAGMTTVILEVALNHRGERTVLGRDSFVVGSDRYAPYAGRFPASETATEDGDGLVVRLIGSGSDFGLQCGPRKSSIRILKASSPLPVDIAEQREQALIWFAAHGKWGLNSDPFRHFNEALDDVILSGADAEWGVGWGLTKSERPFVLEWTDGVFQAKEISVDEANAREIGENAVTFESEG
jgi:hypothetical protein